MSAHDDTTAGVPIDPELSEDLGAEYEFRGDVMDERLEAALSEAEAARAEAEELRDRLLRSHAEFDNYRKRTERERADERVRAGERIIGEILPVIDNLERAIDHTTAGGDLEHLLGGVEAVHAQILGLLAKEGVGVIDPLGEPFDPHKHEAIGQREDVDVPEHTVVDVYRKGYEQGGRIVRHAMVVVSSGGPPATGE